MARLALAIGLRRLLRMSSNAQFDMLPTKDRVALTRAPGNDGFMFIRAAVPALAAALLSGASIPLAKLVVGNMPPLLLAGLLYLGGAIGLGVLLLWRQARDRAAVEAMRIPRNDWPWLFGGRRIRRRSRACAADVGPRADRRHEPLTHEHVHYPDIHRRHGHSH